MISFMTDSLEETCRNVWTYKCNPVVMFLTLRTLMRQMLLRDRG
uniref:Uncharacterized protein n=1 Tax=Anguilla anguilla TaxID=7936 RepID=A0A0E9SAW6_ANGAN